MATTQLSLSAVPGRRYSFVAKDSAVGSHTGGPFTELAVNALPGQPHSFVAKGAAVVGHTGLFTELSVMALPGPRRSFSAKTEADEITTTGVGGLATYTWGDMLALEDEEIMELIPIFLRVIN